MICDILHIKSTNVTYVHSTNNDTTSRLIISIPNVTLTNGQVFTLDICQLIGQLDPGDNPVIIVSDGTSAYNVYLQMGNVARARGLKCRRRLTMVYGTDPLHMTVLSPCLKSY